MSLILDEHRELLDDPVRLGAYEAALRETVRPHHVVLDLGTGTGVLGLLACRAGARRVYSVDEGGMIQVARDICQRNHLSDRVVHIKGLSTRIALPEPADVVVADQIGRFGFEAGIIEYFDDARTRLMKHGGIMIPSAITLTVAPVEAPDTWRNIEFWKAPLAGFDLAAALPIALNTGYPLKLTANQLLGEPSALTVLDSAAPNRGCIKAETCVTIARPGVLHGIGGWFSARLSEHVTMTNSPLTDRSIRRRNVLFPVSRPLAVERGDRAHVAMSIIAADLLVSWRVDIATASGAVKMTSSHSTWRGMLLCTEDLEKMRGDRVPKLSRWGMARRSVLELCDGGRTVTDIESAVHARHADLFPTAAEAARFVAEVLVPYSE